MHLILLCIAANLWLFLAELFPCIVPTEVTVYPQSPQVVKGSSVTLFCNATGVPKPSLKWTENDNSTVLSKSSSLTLPNVDRPGNPSDTTQYHCTASNGYGDPMFKTDTATVTVICECCYILAFTTSTNSP